MVDTGRWINPDANALMPRRIFAIEPHREHIERRLRLHDVDAGPETADELQAARFRIVQIEARQNQLPRLDRQPDLRRIADEGAAEAFGRNADDGKRCAVQLHGGADRPSIAA